MTRLKQLIGLVLLGCCVLQAEAQRTVMSGGFFDNWTLGGVVGASAPVSQGAFWEGMSPLYGVELTKKVVPELGIGLRYTAAHSLTASSNVFDATDCDLLIKINLHNLLVGYKGQPRRFELEAVGGAGWRHLYFPAGEGGDRHQATSRVGLDFNIQLGKESAFTLGVRPAFVWTLSGASAPHLYDWDRCRFELTAGLAFHFLNRNNGRRHFSYVRLHDQSKIDARVAKVEGLSAMVAERDSIICRQQEELLRRQQEADAMRHRADAQVPVEPGMTFVFDKGSDGLPAAQLPQLEAVALYLKAHPSACVELSGSALEDESEQGSEQLAQRRAESVAQLLKRRFGVAMRRIRILKRRNTDAAQVEKQGSTCFCRLAQL